MASQKVIKMLVVESIFNPEKYFAQVTQIRKHSPSSNAINLTGVASPSSWSTKSHSLSGSTILNLTSLCMCFLGSESLGIIRYSSKMTFLLFKILMVLNLLASYKQL